MSPTNQIFARINKLLAVQEGRGATEAEASLAAEHVQRLLQEHNLTLAEVEAAGGTADAAPREKRYTDLRAMYAYQRQLMEQIAENFFCLHRVRKELVRDRGWGAHQKWNATTGETEHYHEQNQHLLVGRAVNVTVALQTYTYLIDAINHACRDAEYDTRSKDGKRFLEGATSRLIERLAERRREQEAESAMRKASSQTQNGTGRELVLSDVYGSEADMNNDVMNGFPVGTTAQRRREQTERIAKREAEQARLVAEGIDETVAFYRAHGYSKVRADELAASWRRRSSQAGRRGGGRGGRAQGWTQSNEAHYRKINSAAYQSGRVAGAKIGLDTQVSANSTKRLGRAK